MMVAIAIIRSIVGKGVHPETAKTEPKGSTGWKWAGSDDDIENYPTAKYCTEMVEFANATGDARLCFDYVPGLKRFTLPELTTFSANEVEYHHIDGDHGGLRVRTQMSGWNTGKMHNQFIIAPNNKEFFDFLLRQTSLTIDGFTLEASGHPWKPDHQPTKAELAKRG